MFCNIACYKMAMLMRIRYLFLAIAIFSKVDGRYVGGFGPLRAGNQRVKIRVKKTHGQISTISTL